MTDLAVEFQNVSKTFSSRDKKKLEEVNALKNLNLSIPRGKFFTLLGPSGCGKTTTLRLIAGFELPTAGEILIHGKPMSQVPPNQRPVNTVFQNYALFPHLTVAQNVGFGLVTKRIPPAEREQRVKEALEMVKLAEMGNRKPSQLSGGQQQRVALARALVNRPEVLLLDEPLGALDLKLRKIMQFELKQIQEQVGITFVYVTHDQEEALTMSDAIAVMKDGVVQQLGDPFTLYKEPANRFVADFIGECNFISGTVHSLGQDVIELNIGGEVVSVRAAAEQPQPGDQVTFALRPEKIALSAIDGTGLSGTVLSKVYIGTDTRYLISLPHGNEVVARVQNSYQSEQHEFAKGDRVKVKWLPHDAHVLKA